MSNRRGATQEAPLVMCKVSSSKSTTVTVTVERKPSRRQTAGTELRVGELPSIKRNSLRSPRLGPSTSTPRSSRGNGPMLLMSEQRSSCSVSPASSRPEETSPMRLHPTPLRRATTFTSGEKEAFVDERIRFQRDEKDKHDLASPENHIETRTTSRDRSDKGSFIRVVTRVRPNLPREIDEPDGLEVLPDFKTLTLFDASGTQEKTFCVDEVLDSRNPAVDQAYVYQKVGRELVSQALRGFNICIFCYGHTGSGKTYTMLGDNTSALEGPGAGLLPRCVGSIFDAISNASRQREDPHFTCEYYELHNEHIRDLLVPPSNNAQKPTVHVHPKYGVRINGVSSSVVQTWKETVRLVNFGNQMRTVAATTMNERSSRSHAIFSFKFVVESQINFEGEEKTASENRVGTHRESTVMFADLAGREDQLVTPCSDDRFREMCHINTSLFHLAHLITKLTEGQVAKNSLADFRNSKLTLLLSQALVGNSCTALVSTVAVPQLYYDDNFATMTFAQKVAKVQNKPVVNNKTSKAVLSDLENEVMMLKHQLQQAQGNSADKEQELLAAQALIEHYKQSWEERKHNSKGLESARSMASMAFGDLADGLGAPKDAETGQLVSFFTKLTDDPSLQGCCNYFLTKPSLTVGSDATNDIVLQGIGVQPRMVEVRTSDRGSEIIVELCLRNQSGEDEFLSEGQRSSSDASTGDDTDEFAEECPRVLINGRALTRKHHCKVLKHGDCIVLGYAHAFRLVAPCPDDHSIEQGLDACSLARSTLPSLDMEQAVSEIHEERGEIKNVLRYLGQLQSIMPQNTAENFVAFLRHVAPLVDEANLLTREVFGFQPLRFELLALSEPCNLEKYHPKLVVCVFQTEADFKIFGVLSKTSSGSNPVSGTSSMSVRSLRSSKEPPAGRAQAGGGRSSIAFGNNHRQRSRSSIFTTLSLIEPENPDGDTLLYVWTLDKFLRRLCEMREIYQEGSESSNSFWSILRRLRSKPFLNPWQELAFADVRLLAAGPKEDSLWTDIVASNVDEELLSEAKDNPWSTSSPIVPCHEPLLIDNSEISEAQSGNVCKALEMSGLSAVSPSSYVYVDAMPSNEVSTTETSPPAFEALPDASKHVSDTSLVHCADLSSESEDKILFCFSALQLEQLSSRAFTSELLDEFRKRGIAESMLSNFRVQLREESVVAEVVSSQDCITELRKVLINSDPIVIMGCRGVVIAGFGPVEGKENSIGQRTMQAPDFHLEESVGTEASSPTNTHSLPTITVTSPGRQTRHVSPPVRVATVQPLVCEDELLNLRNEFQNCSTQLGFGQAIVDNERFSSLLDRLERLLKQAVVSPGSCSATNFGNIPRLASKPVSVPPGMPEPLVAPRGVSTIPQHSVARVASPVRMHTQSAPLLDLAQRAWESFAASRLTSSPSVKATFSSPPRIQSVEVNSSRSSHATPTMNSREVLVATRAASSRAQSPGAQVLVQSNDGSGALLVGVHTLTRISSPQRCMSAVIRSTSGSPTRAASFTMQLTPRNIAPMDGPAISATSNVFRPPPSDLASSAAAEFAARRLRIESAWSGAPSTARAACQTP